MCTFVAGLLTDLATELKSMVALEKLDLNEIIMRALYDVFMVKPLSRVQLVKMQV